MIFNVLAYLVEAFLNYRMIILDVLFVLRN